MLRDSWLLFIERYDFFLELFIQHIEISLISIIFAIIIGGMLGIIISEYQKYSKIILASVNALYTIPSISLLGFLIPLSGIGNNTAIITLTIYALLPMVRNTYTGITNVNPLIIEASTGMGSTKLQTLVNIKLPLALPVIVSGIRNMVTMTIALAGIASFIGAGGLGVAIYRGITTNSYPMIIVGSALIALLALSVDFIFAVFEKFDTNKSKNKNKYIIAIGFVCISFITIFSAFSKNQEDTIKIATKPMTEQYILGEMLNVLIEQELDIDVEVTQGIGGGTSNIHTGMMALEFDIYPEYTGTAWNTVLKNNGIYTEDLFEDLQQQYLENYNMLWLGMYGFNNTYGIVVRTDIADKYNLKTYSDLAKISNELIFGAEYDFFEREDGYKAISEIYGLNFKSTKDMNIGLKYTAINQEAIDVMVIFTTDGQLSQSDVVVLEDDKNFFPSYLIGNIVNGEVIEKYPEITTVLDMLTNTIDDIEMAKMNYKVEEEQKNPEDVALEFLKDKGLLK